MDVYCTYKLFVQKKVRTYDKDTHYWHVGPSVEASHILNDVALTSVQPAHRENET